MPHRSSINDEDYRAMDGWPVPIVGGSYPTSAAVIKGKVYSEEDEKHLHWVQQALEQQRKDAEERFLNGTD
jgi:hypothetical protein